MFPKCSLHVPYMFGRSGPAPRCGFRACTSWPSWTPRAASEQGPTPPARERSSAGAQRVHISKYVQTYVQKYVQKRMFSEAPGGGTPEPALFASSEDRRPLPKGLMGSSGSRVLSLSMAP
eukprot:1188420-Prorocentrum_minimum.AAC.2